ncbi:MAG TPA: hypothetical protein VMS17_23545 [Gemmataceae bacterium]|nr:hypothetical protein [Gemmataceae bacterium]
MVPPQDILGYLRAQPFRPFQIRMTSGRTFEIRHPETLRVGRNSLIVFTAISDDPGIYDRWETISLLLIEFLKHLETSAA